MKKLIFSSSETISVQPIQERIDDILALNENRATVCHRRGATLNGYSFSSQANKWIKLWNETIFPNHDNYPLDKYPWLVTNRLQNDSAKDVIIVHHPHGVQFYQIDSAKPGLNLLKEDGDFHEVYGYTLLIGYFYPDTNEIGVMARKNTVIDFFVITNKSLDPSTNHPLYHLASNYSIPLSWKSQDTEFFLTKFRNNDIEAIGLWNNEYLEFYEFNSNYLLDKILSTSCVPKFRSNSLPKDRLFFGNLTHQKYQDIIHLNNSGLFTYQYDQSQGDYRSLNCHTGFASYSGWSSSYSDSIRLFDLNNDGRDDIVFTGIEGLMGLTFDVNTNKWKNLLKTQSSPAVQRFGTVVRMLPAFPPDSAEASIFIRDTQGKIQWASIGEDTAIATITPPSPNVSKLSPSNVNQPSKHNHIIPALISRDYRSRKPILRWLEEWPDNFLKDSVDAFTGQVRFSIPLFDISDSTGWNILSSMSYDSTSKNNDLIGFGWSMSLGQNYIAVDYQQSIFSQDARYYIVIEGQPRFLKLIRKEKELHYFGLTDQSKDDPKLTVCYNHLDESWMISSPSQESVYGSAKSAGARDALQFNLAWPNWRGMGRNEDRLEPLIGAWYINSRFNILTNETLYYYYDKKDTFLDNGKSYTSGIYLERITDRQDIDLIFEYSFKAQAEYAKSGHIDEKGNLIFPVKPELSHFLNQFSISTSDYQQRLNFNYKLHDGTRVLTGIDQEILPGTESLLRFDYVGSSGHPLIGSCNLSSKSKVHFSYGTSEQPEFLPVERLPIREIPKIAHGLNYTVIAYRNLHATDGRIFLRVMNRAMTETLIDCLVDEKLTCPSSKSEIIDYGLHAHKDSFAVHAETKGKTDFPRKSLYIYHRKNESWSLNDPIYHFSQNSMIQFTEKIFIVADARWVQIYEYDDIQFKWNKVFEDFKCCMATRLTIHNHLLASYDDHQLSIYYRDSESSWKSKILAEDLEKNFDLEKIDLNPDMRDELSKLFNRFGLQIQNNLILLYSVSESDGQLSIHINLFLLDSNYNISKTDSFVIYKQNLFDLNHELKIDGNTFKINYIKESIKLDGRTKVVYKAKIISASGAVVSYIENISNKNRREDAMKKEIKSLNENDDFIKFFKRNFLIDQKSYICQMSSLGVIVGNDTLIRMTGTEWIKESFNSREPLRLGEHFILDPSGDSSDEGLLKLRKRTDDDTKTEKQQTLELTLNGRNLINKYPAYIAHNPKPDLVEVITFKDEKTLGVTYKFWNEQLHQQGCDFYNIVTVANTSTTGTGYAENLSCVIRPTFSLNAKNVSFVNQLKFTDLFENIVRITNYERYFEKDVDSSMFSETLKIMPGTKKNAFGWLESTKSFHRGNYSTTQDTFNFDGSLATELTTDESDNAEATTNRSQSESNRSILLDKSGSWQISDFSPYTLADETVAYFGFEPYELNRIVGWSSMNATNTRLWQINRATIVKDNFAFTGRHYLKLNGDDGDDKSFLEVIFNPRDQTNTYLASCWIRSYKPMLIGTAVPYLKAILYTADDQKIIGLQSTVKNQMGDWSHLELELSFDIIKQIYRDYFSYIDEKNSNHALIDPDEANFKIKLRVETIRNEVIDIDHIRFSPIRHDFEANVYNPISGKMTEIIKSSGLIVRFIYNYDDEQIANTDENGHIREFKSTSNTGKIFPTPSGIKLDTRPGVSTFKPEDGSYESFDRYSLGNRWEVDSDQAWNIGPGMLRHTTQLEHSIKPIPNLFDPSYAAIRFYFVLQERTASVVLNWSGIGSLKLSQKSSDSSIIELPDDNIITSLPSTGELIVMLDENCFWLWFDGVLISERELSVANIYTADSINPWLNFVLKAQGDVLIRDLLIMNRPQVEVQYFNSFGEVSQVIKLEDCQTAQITETLYDELGRKAINTKRTRIKRAPDGSLLNYRSTFVLNKNPSDPESVWNNGKLNGEADSLNPLDGGYAYERIQFEPNPLSQEKVVGLAGPEFSITGKFAVKKSQYSNISFLDNLFPEGEGYRQKVVYKSNGSIEVEVYDKNMNKVAVFTKVPSYNHILSTYEYDQDNRLLKILPPLYHEKVKTDSKTAKWKPGETDLTDEEKSLQKSLATYFNYDENGRIICKITPDTGVTSFIYNALGQKRFMISSSKNKTIENIVYFDYEVNGEIARIGHLLEKLSIDELEKLAGKESLPKSKIYQEFNYANDHSNPLIRGRLKYYITNDNFGPTIEKVYFDVDEQVSNKTVITKSDGIREQMNVLEKQYVDQKVVRLSYPISSNGQKLVMKHKYNGLGQLIEISTSDQSIYKATFSYHGHGQLATESYEFGTSHNFIRHYEYDSPGFLKKISDPFLIQEIDYTSRGYGQNSYGDGMVMRTSFNSSWPLNSDPRWFQVRDEDIAEDKNAPKCIRALKRRGYLDSSGQPKRLFVEGLETRLPFSCTGHTMQLISETISRKQLPQYYGHSYAYGNYQELVKAKYFTDNTEHIQPLNQDTFFEDIPELGQEKSRNIWHILSESGYIIKDNLRADPSTATGKPGPEFFINLLGCERELANLTIYHREPIRKLIISTISEQKSISLAEFRSTFSNWEDVDNTPTTTLLDEKKRKTAEQIGQMLIDKSCLPRGDIDLARLLSAKFISLLRDDIQFIPQILKTLSRQFALGLGKTAFDLDSYNIDANGNHRLFRTGFDRYELNYHNGTNQIESIKLNSSNQLKPDKSSTFSIKHDKQGNIIQALHKNIQNIDYHPVSQRTTSIQLTDGRTLRFGYDAAGERLLKEVRNARGDLIYQKHYLRDERANVLIDQEIRYVDGKIIQNIKTAYMYGPRGLLGFIRNNNFHSVTIDHAGSIRLVIRHGKVVAAYDYLPYGGAMRSFGNDPEAQISYRYSGHEWDEETGLYNFHARLYDPSIGRFYQPDPKSQYFSPYIYAGNSPVSLTDPDGEFAWMIAFFFIGAFLGGAAVNNRWNPIKWDFSDSGTWLGIIGGGFSTAFLPVGGWSMSLLTAAKFGVGTGVAYIAGAGANGSWDPKTWDFASPSTWSDLLGGFATGAGLFGLGRSVHKQFGKPKPNAPPKSDAAFNAKWGRTMLVGSYGLGLGGGLIGFFAALDWKADFSPAALSAGIGSIGLFFGFPQAMRNMKNGLKKLKTKKELDPNDRSQMQRLKKILKDPTHPFYKVAGAAVMAYLMGSKSNKRWDRWDGTVFSTYSGVLGGIFLGRGLSTLKREAQKAKEAKNSKKLNMDTTSKSIDHSTTNYVTSLRQIFNDGLRLINQLQVRLSKQEFSDRGISPEIQPDNSQPNDGARSVSSSKAGSEKSKGSQNEIPEEVRMAQEANRNNVRDSRELIIFEEELREESRAKRELFPDEEVGFLNCVVEKSGERSSTHAIICFSGFSSALGQKIEFATYFVRDVSAQDEFVKDPIEFLHSNALSAAWLNHMSSKNIDTNRSIKLMNGANLPFCITKSVDTTGYLLFPCEDKLPNPSIKAYWLATEQKITIDAHNGPRLVFTAQLQGCSLYVRFNRNSGQPATITIFHHCGNYYSDLPGGKSIDLDDGAFMIKDASNNIEKYDDVLSWEEYGINIRDPSFGQNSTERVWTTPIIYRKDTPEGQKWVFLYQRQRYSVGRSLGVGQRSHRTLEKFSIESTVERQIIDRLAGFGSLLNQTRIPVRRVRDVSLHISEIYGSNTRENGATEVPSHRELSRYDINNLTSITNNLSTKPQFSNEFQTNSQTKKLSIEWSRPKSGSFHGNSSGPNDVEIENKFINNTNINGILSLTDLIIRKWTEYRPKPSRLPNDPYVDKNGIDILSAIRSGRFL